MRGPDPARIAGPVFFRQERVGRNGKPFEVLKFRTMVDNAEAAAEVAAEPARPAATRECSRSPTTRA